MKRWLTVFIAAWSLSAAADERILEFHSDIQIHPDASLLVTEHITVRAEGRNIRRGIYREFPTRYRDRFGNRYRVRFELESVKRDQRSEPHHTERRSNGLRIYIGSASTMLSPGVYHYQIQYRTWRQLGHFEDMDELYWNVTGNGWAFPIDRATARVNLPGNVAYQDLRLAAYTGPQGSSSRDATSEVTGARSVQFSTTRPLGPGEGLTIAVGWPRGLIERPGLAQRLNWFFSDNKGALALIAAWLAALAWYVRAWHHHGRDPARGVIIPRFEPPAGISAAGSRYVLDMGLKARCLTAAIISLAVKGHLKIDERDDDFFLYRMADATAALTPGESAVLASLLPEHDSWIELDNEQHRAFRAARQGLAEALRSEHRGRLFVLNSVFALPAVGLTIVGVILGAMAGAGPLAWILFGIATVSMHLVFLWLLRAPTPAGRRIMDEIEGFRMYLETAERDRLDRMRSPELTPEVFEMFLPYAYALGVENRWCARFEREFPREASEYEPNWYSGRHRGHGFTRHLGDKLGSGLSSAISSASTPPGSSSGSGGGGFSGGGGGGGGGGGW